jgi:signal transduction histidine kinase
LAISLAFFIPLIVISSLLVGYMVSSTQDQLNEDYLSRAKNFAATLATSIGETDSLLTDSPPVNFITQANAWNLDATLFDTRGHVLTTTQPRIFENRLLAPALHPNAVRLQRSGEAAFVTMEGIGDLVHYVAYARVNDDQGLPSALVGIPFYRSRESLDQLRASVFADVLLVFTAVFVVMILLSFAVARWITYPLRVITPRLSRISWVSNPQPIEWKADDEIGLMVKEYNAMLIKLKDSKSELERAQREQAWREIAQQVAHEIKNPLTPMKLSLQQLQRSQPENQALQKSLDSLLVQVDLLNGIASSFSSFARMPAPQLKPVDVAEAINGVVEMYRQEGEIRFQTVQAPCYALADKALLIRIVSNLILNGIQAAVTSAPRVQVAVENHEDKIIVRIRDNGSGIDPEMQAKVFQPHFTTKKTGSGLGLAIARQGIEQMGGDIGFESQPGEGSTFFFTLRAYPLHGVA